MTRYSTLRTIVGIIVAAIYTSAVPTNSNAFGSDWSENTPSAIVSLTFDDATALEWNGFIAAKKYGFAGTLYPMIGNVDKEWGLTWDQIRTMHAQGWEIGAHTDTHPDLTKITDPLAFTHELLYPKYRIGYEIGELPVSFASPFGNYNDSVIAEVKKYYDLHVTAWGDSRETDGRNVPGRIDPLRISRIDVGLPHITAADVCKTIDEAVEKNLWLILLFHTIPTEEPGEYQMGLSTFESVMKCLHEKVHADGVRVATVRDAYRHYTKANTLAKNEKKEE